MKEAILSSTCRDNRLSCLTIRKLDIDRGLEDELDDMRPGGKARSGDDGVEW